MSAPRTIFLGTPETAVPTLRALHRMSEVCLVVTRPDRARGRSGSPAPPPVKQVALELGLSVAQPQNKADLHEVVDSLPAVELGVVTAYGMIIPDRTLRVPRLGMVNLHFSLLPRWRGAAPVQAAIRSGDEVTGITMMQMDAGLDTGPILAAAPISILPFEDAGSLSLRLGELAADSLERFFSPLLAGTLPPTFQDERLASHAPSLRPADRELDLTVSTVEAARQVRALAPKPGATALIDGVRFRVLEVAESSREVSPGQLEIGGERAWLGAADGSLRLLTLQPPGRRTMSAAAWLRGRREPDG